MKNITLTLIFTLLFTYIGISQSCLPGYNRFFTQAEIDDFLVNFPNCTSIEGNLVIWELDAGSITNLDAFQNITEVQGFLQVRGNVQLENIDGLSNLKNVRDHVYLQGNDLLDDFKGLSNLETVGGFLFIGQHDLLTSLKGLEKLTSIGGYLNIRNNDSLQSLKGLKNLSVIDGRLNIQENPNLTSLIGLDKISPASIKSSDDSFNDFTLAGNVNLNYCNSQLLCTFFDIPGVDYLFVDNSVGCNSAQTIMMGCIQDVECLPNGGLFDTQEKIDLLPFQNYGCKTIGGDVVIADEDLGTITDLDGFSQIEFIEGELSVSGNFALDNICGLGNLREVEKSLFINFAPELNSLSPLSNLTSVGDNLTISQMSSLNNLNGLEGINVVNQSLRIKRNNNLESLDGLHNISTVGFHVDIEGNKRLKNLQGLTSLTSVAQDLDVSENDSLTAFIGLESLTSVGRELYMFSNPSLPNLNGLENINFIGGGIVLRDNNALQNLEGLNPFDHDPNVSLYIYDNDILSLCNSEAICQVIKEEGYREIRDNAPGCNSLEDVELSCIVSTKDIDSDKLQLYPNPAHENITLKAEHNPINVVSVYNFSGERILKINNLSNTTEYILDINDLPNGTFVLQTVDVNGTIFNLKFVKM